METKSEDVRRKSMAEAEEHIKEYKSCDMTQKAYCEQKGINIATFAYWMKRHRETRSSEPGGFIRIEPSAKSTMLEILFANGVVVRFNTLVEASYVKALIG